MKRALALVRGLDIQKNPRALRLWEYLHYTLTYILFRMGFPEKAFKLANSREFEGFSPAVIKKLISGLGNIIVKNAQLPSMMKSVKLFINC